VKQYEWYMLYQRRSNGLYWSNTFQEATIHPGMPWHLCCFDHVHSAMSADILSKMATISGRPDLAAWFTQEAPI